MENLYNTSPADLLHEVLQDIGPALDRRSQERLKAGIESLLAENRDLAARAARSEEEVSEALRESEERYRSFVENFQGIAFQADLAFTPIFLHGAVEAITGYTEEAFMKGKVRWSAIIHPEDRPAVSGLAKRVAASEPGVVIEREYRIVRKDGEIRWIRELVHTVERGPRRERRVQGSLYDVTDYKRAEERLRESEATARALLNAPTDTIALLDTAGRLLDVNDAVIRRFSRSREELIGMNISEVFPPTVTEVHAARLRKVAESGAPVRFEEVWEGRWYDTVLYPVRDAHGAVTRIAVIARDITGMKQAEDALRRRTHDLDERVKELSCLYAISRIVEQPGVSLDRILQEAALALPQGWQYPDDTVVRITVHGRKFETEGFRETPWRQVSPVLVDRNPVGMVEVRYLHRRPEEDEGPFLREERSLLDTVASRLGEAIERLQAVENLRRSEEKFREIAQRSFDMIYTCYHEGGIAYISPAVIRILGYTPAELIGSRCRDFVSSSSLPAWEEGQKKIARGEPVEGLEIEFYRKDGSAAFVELNESPIVREQAVIGVHVVGRDITERKQYERLRQQAFEQIERNIEQFAVLGDHIRQPLQVILGTADLSVEGAATAKIREQVDRINGYIRELDRGWIESRQVREFLRKHELA
ncbi:PAS domain-containing protein [Methanoculleus sp. 7T]|uniref:PAS domain-containing protein n=1 Tax=Methanoculleus sp. 7T TaxID=2937282 RepID=UPI0020C0E331|nr:PAS domain S-box protein [Methanoculleus sp. 7T]MCK8519553.1 PAS domain S-box protein [Methanoculleus sp. 7T]